MSIAEKHEIAAMEENETSLYQPLATDRTIGWSLFDIGLYVVMQLTYGVAAFIAAMAIGLVPQTFDPAYIDLRDFLAATLVGLILASTHMMYLRRRSVKSAWKYSPPSNARYPKLFSIGIMGTALLLGAIYTNIINQPLQPEYEVLGEMLYDGGWQALAVLLAVVVFGPAVEEALFRVQLQAAIGQRLKSKIGEQKAVIAGILASTLLFALIHFQFTAAPAQFLLGAALAIIYQRHRSFAEIWILHSAVNLLGILTINS